MEDCLCFIQTEKLSDFQRLRSYMNLYGFLPQGELPDRDRTELLILDLDTVELKEWLDRRDEEGLAHIPFLCLSSEMGESRQVNALSAGAQDILPRDLHPSLICQRIVTLVRVIPGRGKKSDHNERCFILPGGNRIDLDTHSREIRRNNRIIHFTPREWEIFLLLLNKINRVVSRDAILDMIQGDSLEGTDRLVDSHIKNLRRKLGDKEGIETERGYGYKLQGRTL